MQHEMSLAQTDTTGRELWECGECERKLLIRWQPFHREVLLRGDDSVSHSGGKGGLKVTATPRETQRVL
jgi:hypothetical protein